MNFLKTPVVIDETIASDGVKTYPLPTLPISHLEVTIKALNVTDEATLGQLLSLISNLKVVHLGTAVFDMSASDAYALNAALLNQIGPLENPVSTDNAVRTVGFRVPFGRKLYNPIECFKATKRGELELQFTADIANTDADGLIMQITAVQLPDASPAQFLKVNTINKTPSATGYDKVSLPIGPKLAGILLYSTTVPTGTAWTATIDQLELLVNDAEQYFTSEYWETMHQNLAQRISQAFHPISSSAYDRFDNYAYLDFDPSGDDRYLLETQGKSSLDLNISFGDTNAIRVLPLGLKQF